MTVGSFFFVILHANNNRPTEKMNLNNAKYYVTPVVVCLVALAALTYYYFMTAFTTGCEATHLYIDNDDTPDSVYAKLQPAASPHSMTGLRTLMRHGSYHDHMHTGHYVVEPDMSTLGVYRLLSRGQQTPVRLTVPPVRTIGQMAAALGHRLMADSTALADALADSSLVAQLGFDSFTLPALFIPNTYEVYWNVSPQKLMERMKKEHDAFWTSGRQQKARALQLTPVEVQTLASIVDEETAVGAEKPRVAGLYLNRLAKGMLLQADPTVKYAVGDFTLRRILNRHLAVESPYNTYRHAGLPPGPIRIATVQAIDAVLNAEHHDYLYMCAKEDFSGTHNFARTSAEHMQNARRYQQALNALNIKR